MNPNNFYWATHPNNYAIVNFPVVGIDPHLYREATHVFNWELHQIWGFPPRRPWKLLVIMVLGGSH
jgi:hypothetical protein